MFRIVFFVEDKNLPKVLHAVQGMVLNMEPPQPVVNATVKEGKVQAASSGTATWERLWDEVIKCPTGPLITSADLKRLITKVGGQVGSFSYFLKVLKDNNVLKSTKKRGEYVVLNGKEK